MGQTALLPLRRKVCWGFFALKNPTASAGFEPTNLGTKNKHATSRPPKPLSLSWKQLNHTIPVLSNSFVPEGPDASWILPNLELSILLVIQIIRPTYDRSATEIRLVSYRLQHYCVIAQQYSSTNLLLVALSFPPQGKPRSSFHKC